MNKDQIAKVVFKENPEANNVFITSDGTPFLTENAANLHATRNAQGKILTVTTYQREAGDEDPKSKEVKEKKQDKNGRGSVEDRIEAIKKAKTVEAVKELLKGEKAKTVKAFAKEQIAAIEEAVKKAKDKEAEAAQQAAEAAAKEAAAKEAEAAKENKNAESDTQETQNTED